MALYQDTKMTGAIIGAAIEVHQQLGAGLLESVYQTCLIDELNIRGLYVEREIYLPVYYKGRRLPQNYRIDLLVEDTVIVEIKSVATLHPIHHAQLLTYLRLTHKTIGLLINFNTTHLPEGIRRVLL